MSTHERGGFEERLLVELRRVVGERPSPDRGRVLSQRSSQLRLRLALVGATAAVLAVGAGVGVPFLSSGGTAAYAVTKNDDGSVTVEIDSLSDAAGLQRELREAGVPAFVQYFPPGKTCRKPNFVPATDGAPTLSSVDERSGTVRFTIDRSALAADRTLVIQTSVGAAEGAAASATAVSIAWAKGEVKACELVDAPAGSGPLPIPPGAQTSSRP